jgi:hypothetical protein
VEPSDDTEVGEAMSPDISRTGGPSGRVTPGGGDGFGGKKDELMSPIPTKKSSARSQRSGAAHSE